MWRPKGYLYLKEVAGNILLEVEKIIIVSCLLEKNDRSSAEEFAKLDPNIHVMQKAKRLVVEAGDAENEIEAELAIYVVFAWVFLNLLEEYPPVLMTSNGGEVEVIEGLFWHRDQIEVCSVGWPLFNLAEFQYYRNAIANGGFSAEEFLDRFTSLDFENNCLKLKNGSAAHIENLFEREEAQEVLEAISTFSEHKIFWGPNFEHKCIGKFMSALAHVERFSEALSLLYKFPSSALESVQSSIADETRAELEARRLLAADTEKSLRKRTLKAAVNPRLGVQAWNRVIGKLRSDYPHISLAGAPRKSRT